MENSVVCEFCDDSKGLKTTQKVIRVFILVLQLMFGLFKLQYYQKPSF